MTGKRGTSRAELEAKRADFERYIRQLTHKEEITKLMGISERTYYRWFEKSQAEAAKFAEDLAKVNYPLYFRRTIEGWEDQIRELSLIRERTDNAQVKVNATALIGEFIGAIQAAVNRGPSALNVVENLKRLAEVDKLKAEVASP